MQTIAFSNKLFSIVDKGAELDKLETGFAFTEGPVWDEREAALYFTDFRNLKIYRRDEGNGLTVFDENSGRAVGITLDLDGNIISCESLNRRIVRLGKKKEVSVLAADFRGSRLNSPNDVIVKSDGAVYFTDPYSTSLGLDRDLGFNGVFRIEPETGNISLLTDEFSWPNGLAFSPDEKILFINDTSLNLIKAFDVTADGHLVHARVFANLDKRYGKGAPDGMKVDEMGNVYVTGPGGIWIFDQEGERIGILITPEPAGNLCWGGPDARTLFIAASTSLYSICMNHPGILPKRRGI